MKGDADYSYRGAHSWVRGNKLKPELCERCEERSAIELSYKGKGYSRNPEDYEWLCISCHRLKDQGNGAIMTKARIHRIREFYKCKAATRQELTKLFSVGMSTISDILYYRGIYRKPMNPNIFKELLKGLNEIKEVSSCA